MKQIRFYDNDQTNINAVKKNRHIKCYKVPSQEKIDTTARIEYIENLLKTRRNKFFNSYVYPQIIEKAIERNVYPEFNYDDKSGLSSAAINDLIEWASDGGKVVIFDLDRTLIKTEGFGIFFRSRQEADDIFAGNLDNLMRHLGVKESDIEETIKHFFYYICGGMNRYLDLSTMFVMMSIYGVDTYINSSNEKCNSSLFREILHRMFGSDIKLQCSGKNKLAAIMKSPNLRRRIDDTSATTLQMMVRRRSLKKKRKSKRT
jgi:hypothetical protein